MGAECREGLGDQDAASGRGQGEDLPRSRPWGLLGGDETGALELVEDEVDGGESDFSPLAEVPLLDFLFELVAVSGHLGQETEEEELGVGRVSQGSDLDRYSSTRISPEIETVKTRGPHGHRRGW